jgi:hypothetical protein
MVSCVVFDIRMEIKPRIIRTKPVDCAYEIYAASTFQNIRLFFKLVHSTSLSASRRSLTAHWIDAHNSKEQEKNPRKSSWSKTEPNAHSQEDEWLYYDSHGRCFHRLIVALLSVQPRMPNAPEGFEVCPHIQWCSIFHSL